MNKAKTNLFLTLSMIALVTSFYLSFEQLIVYSYSSSEGLSISFSTPTLCKICFAITVLFSRVLLVLLLLNSLKNKKSQIIVFSLITLAAENIFSIVTIIQFFHEWNMPVAFSVWFAISALLSFFCILALFLFLLKKNIKFFVLISSVLGMILAIKTIVNYVPNLLDISNEFFLVHVLSTIAYIGEFIFYFAIFLLAVLNKKIVFCSLKTDTINTTPEEKLLMLKNQLDQGSITLEDYQKQRTEILQTL